MINFQIDDFLYVRIDVWVKMTKKKKEKSTCCREATRARSRPVLAGSGGEQGEARPAISAPSGGPHRDLGRLRLKTWSKIEFSIAETTGRTHLHMYF